MKELTRKLYFAASSLNNPKRIQRLLIILILCLLSLPALAQSGDGLWKTYLEAAAKSRDNKNYDEAEKLYRLAEAKAAAFGEADERYARTQIILTSFFLNQKKHTEAEESYKKVLASLAKGAGPSSQVNASLVYSLAQIYSSQRRYAEAEPLYQTALAIYRRVLKPGDITVSFYLHSLGNNYFGQQKLDDAEKVFKEELAILEPDPVLSKSQEAAYAFGYLALIAQAYEKYDEAEKYLTRGAEVMKSLRGENHPETASMLKALAIIFRKQETRYADAVAVMRRAQQIDEAVYGKTSKEVAGDLDFLADVHQAQTHYDEAVPLLIRALGILDEVATVTPAEYSTIAHDLANNYSLKHNYAEGEAVCRRMAENFAKRSQKDPENDLLVNTCLGDIYFDSGNYLAEAQILRDSIAIAEKLGPPHEIDMASDLVTLGSDYARQEKYDDALATLRRAETIYAKDPSKPQPVFLVAMARYYYFTGKYAESETYFVKLMAVMEPKKDASSGYDTALYRKAYSLLLYAQNKTAQADEMFQKALDKLKTGRVSGKRHVAGAWHELGTLFAKQGKYAEAEAPFKTAIELREQALGPNHPDLASSLEGYTRVLHKLGRAPEAAPLEERARAIRARQKQ
jgi:tetratricopeptide (TPR) repeat protein